MGDYLYIKKSEIQELIRTLEVAKLEHETEKSFLRGQIKAYRAIVESLTEYKVKNEYQ